MIVGNGLVANVFSKYANDNKVIIFASGVSNSKENNDLMYEREKNLLTEIIYKNNNSLLVYFSTTSVYDIQMKSSKYCQHKLQMENLIQESVKAYIIFRLSEVVGKIQNEYQIINFLSTNIRFGTKFNIWKNATRHFIDVEDVGRICSYIIDNKVFKNKILNVASPTQSNILDIVEILERIFSKKANYVFKNIGTSYNIDILDIDSIVKKLDIKFNYAYVNKLIHKYIRE